MSEPTPWASWLVLAALRFHISPEQFWRLSFREWRLLLGQIPRQTQPLVSDELVRLMHQYPDAATPAKKES